MNDSRVLRLIDRAPPAPRLNVRVSAFSTQGGPHGRSRAFKLREADLEQLLDLAERLEQRGRR